MAMSSCLTEFVVSSVLPQHLPDVPVMRLLNMKLAKGHGRLGLAQSVAPQTLVHR